MSSYMLSSSENTGSGVEAGGGVGSAVGLGVGVAGTSVPTVTFCRMAAYSSVYR